MCGIAGTVGVEAETARRAVERMSARMLPRGPDDAGVALPGGEPPVVLGARRLAIIDPSPAGHQPMTDAGRGTTLVFNGMIYNFRELRAQLEREGERFSSGCDAEVVLRAYGRYGAGAVERLRGMFAFAIWDARRGELFLARDRLGIKPLYYAPGAGSFVFASQVKALLASGLVAPRLSTEGIRTYLSFGAVSEPLTAIESVRALPAAHTAVVRDGRVRLARYWALPDETWPAGRNGDLRADLRGRLEETVGRHLVSDVPLGVFLSGGLDSSVVAALAGRQTDRLRTVSVVFAEPEFSEAPYIEAVARMLRSDHVTVPLAARDVLDLLDGAFDAMDQPSYDGINTYVVAKAASETGLKVALSGLGGDELFDGYGYGRRAIALERLARAPRPLARATAAAARWRRDDRAAEKLGSWTAGGWRAGSSYELLRRLFLPDEVRALAGSADGVPVPGALDPGGDVVNQVSALDLTNYTKNVLLRDTDAMGMGRSLEVRVPFLDHELVEWTLRLPGHARARRSKELLAGAVRDIVPDAVLRRGKQGFLLPFAQWLADGLRAEVDERLRHPPVDVAELVDTAAMRTVWASFGQDGRSWLQPWSLYALCRWAESARALAR